MTILTSEQIEAMKLAAAVAGMSRRLSPRTTSTDTRTIRAFQEALPDIADTAIAALRENETLRAQCDAVMKDPALILASAETAEAEIMFRTKKLNAAKARVKLLETALGAIIHHEQGYAPELRATARAALEAKP